MNATEAVADRARKVLTPNYRPQPIALVRGAGTRVWDVDGKEYLDFLGGVAVNLLGHCHPALVKAIEEQARTLWHVSNHFYIPRQIELAEALLARTPFARRAFFCNSGAEANEAMLKLARKYHADRGHPERNEIVACRDSFHGRTLFTVTVGGQEKYPHGLRAAGPGGAARPLRRRRGAGGARSPTGPPPSSWSRCWARPASHRRAGWLPRARPAS